MDKQIILSIGREYGSCGHEIAYHIAEEMHLALYDRRLLDDIAKDKGIDPALLEHYDEKKRNVLFSRTVKGYSNSIADAVWELQKNYILEKAASGESFVIVGRCANVILKGNDALFSVFIVGDIEPKIRHLMDKFGMTRQEAQAKIKKHDASRRAYHNSHAQDEWGDARGYDMCINSSRLGQEKTADVIRYYMLKKLEK